MFLFLCENSNRWSTKLVTPNPAQNLLSQTDLEANEEVCCVQYYPQACFACCPSISGVFVKPSHSPPQFAGARPRAGGYRPTIMVCSQLSALNFPCPVPKSSRSSELKFVICAASLCQSCSCTVSGFVRHGPKRQHDRRFRFLGNEGLEHRPRFRRFVRLRLCDWLPMQYHFMWLVDLQLMLVFDTCDSFCGDEAQPYPRHALRLLLWYVEWTGWLKSIHWIHPYF